MVVVCSICTGRHETSACVIGRDMIVAMLSAGTPQDHQPTPVFQIPSLDQLRARRWAIKADEDGERHLRLVS